MYSTLFGSEVHLLMFPRIEVKEEFMKRIIEFDMNLNLGYVDN